MHDPVARGRTRVADITLVARRRQQARGQLGREGIIRRVVDGAAGEVGGEVFEVAVALGLQVAAGEAAERRPAEGFEPEEEADRGREADAVAGGVPGTAAADTGAGTLADVAGQGHLRDVVRAVDYVACPVR